MGVAKSGPSGLRTQQRCELADYTYNSNSMLVVRRRLGITIHLQSVAVGILQSFAGFCI